MADHNNDVLTDIQKDMDRMFKSIESIDSRPTQLTAAQFKKFEPLFQASNVELAESDDRYKNRFKELTREFQDLVTDLYKPIEIVKSATDLTVVLRLPPIISQAASLDNNKENDILASSNTASIGNSVPKYRAEAFGKYLDAILKAQQDALKSNKQNRNIVEAYKQEFEDRKAGKQIDTNSSPVAKVEQPSVNIDAGDFTWD